MEILTPYSVLFRTLRGLFKRIQLWTTVKCTGHSRIVWCSSQFFNSRLATLNALLLKWVKWAIQESVAEKSGWTSLKHTVLYRDISKTLPVMAGFSFYVSHTGKRPGPSWPSLFEKSLWVWRASVSLLSPLPQEMVLYRFCIGIGIAYSI